MADPDVEKGKKKRKRRSSARLYENLNKPVRQRSVAVDELARDDAAEECATPDEVKATGNPVPPSPGSRPVTDRVSPPLLAGHAAPSSGDHGAAFSDPMNQPGPRALAMGHQDLRQSSTSFDSMLARLRTVNGDNANGDRAVTYTAGEVGLDLFNARGQAGQYRGMGPVGHSPERPDWHPARNSATPPNGSHGLGDVRSHAAPMAAKAMTGSEALQVMRQNQRRV